MRSPLFALSFAFLCPISVGVASDAPGITPDQLLELRREARERQRRIIFNNDGGDACVHNNGRGAPPSDDKLIEAFIDERDPRKGGQIDSVFYCSGAGLGLCWHATKIGTEISLEHSSEECRAHNLVPRLRAAGTDPLAEMVKVCRESGKEIFWSMRMNDTHDANAPILLSDFKKKNPDVLMGTASAPPARTTWSAVDYGSAKVRDFAVSIIREVVENYDVDGVELDFFRHPQLFRSVANGGTASPKDLEKMTGLIERIRAVLDETALKKGKPLLLAVRAPDSLEYCKAIGIDLERWFELGLVDLSIAGGYFRLGDWGESVKLGHRHGVKVYADLSDSRVLLNGKLEPRRISPAGYRGRALEALDAGVDGIYMFNFFRTDRPQFSELGSLETLRGKDRFHVADVLGLYNAGRWVVDGAAYARRPSLTPEQPLRIPEGGSVEIPLRIPLLEGEEGARLELLVLSTAPADSLQAALNGVPLQGISGKDQWVRFPVDRASVQKGVNIFRLKVPPSAKMSAGLAWDGKRIPAWPWVLGRLTPAVAAETRDNGLLIADRGTKPGEDIYAALGWGIRPEDATKATVRLKTLKGWSGLIVSNGKSWERVRFYPDRVELPHAGLVHKMDASGDFHEYAVEIQNDDIRLHVDGKLCLDGKGRFTRAGGDQNIIAFGAADGASTGEAIWAGVDWRTERADKAALIGDLVLSVAFVRAVQQIPSQEILMETFLPAIPPSPLRAMNGE